MNAMARRIEGSIYIAMALVFPPLFWLSQRHPDELDVWFVGIVSASLLYCAALRFARGWALAILIVLGVLAALYLAALVALLVAAASYGIGPHWGWI